MNTRWIVVAHRGGAKIYEQVGKISELRLVKELPFPEGKQKNKEIVSDRPGRSYVTPSLGVHPMSPEVEPREHLLEVFSKDLAELLDASSYQKLCNEVVLVAEPHLLGRLRAATEHGANTKIAATLAKDLAKCSEADIIEQLDQL